MVWFFHFIPPVSPEVIIVLILRIDGMVFSFYPSGFTGGYYCFNPSD